MVFGWRRKISRSKFWKCPQCGLVIQKKLLGKRWKSGESLGRIHGEGWCPGCAAYLPQKEVYGGKYDIDLTVQIQDKKTSREELSVLAYVVDQWHPPANPGHFIRFIVNQRYPESERIKKGYILGTSEDVDYPDLYADYLNSVRLGKVHELGTQFDAFLANGPAGERIMALLFH
jgi:ssDNA-binding Zn-finger/Zn-ribbon topoisomerase 1